MRDFCWPLTLMLVAGCFSDPIHGNTAGSAGDSTDGGSTIDGDGDAGDGDGDAGDGDGDGEPQCVPTPPSDWEGPVALNLGTAPEGLGCDPSWPVAQATGGVGDPSGPPSCNACMCGAASGAECPASVSFGRYPGDPGCQMGPAESANSTTGCDSFGGVKLGYVTGFPPTPTPGVCPAMGGGVMNPDQTFAQFGKVCGLQDQAPECDGGVTVPGFQQPSDWATCIVHDGALPSCPPGSDYSSGPIVIADMVQDTRACSDCTCSPSGEVQCSPYATVFFADGGCGGVPTGVAYHDGTCSVEALSIQSWQLQMEPMVINQGNCMASGGEPMGSVTIEHQSTLCCL